MRKVEITLFDFKELNKKQSEVAIAEYNMLFGTPKTKEDKFDREYRMNAYSYNEFGFIHKRGDLDVNLAVIEKEPNGDEVEFNFFKDKVNDSEILLCSEEMARGGKREGIYLHRRKGLSTIVFFVGMNSVTKEFLIEQVG